MRLAKRLRALLVAVLLATGAATTLSTATLLSTATPAFAGSGGGRTGHHTPKDCWDLGCNTLNPQTTGCSSSAYTVFQTLYGVYHFTDLFGYVELRYSTGCGSNWSRVTVASGIAPAETVGATVYNSLDGGATINQTTGNCYTDGFGAYSCMLGGAAESDKALGSINTPNGAGVGQSPWG